MDEFGVLVESIGFKSQEKSAPMAHMKSKPKTNDSFNNDFPQNTVISSTNRSKSTLYNDSFVDDLDGFFQSKNNSYCQRGPKFFDDGNDIFGGSFVNLKQGPASERGIDLDSVFDLKNSSSKASSNIYDDLLTSGPREGDAIDDFLGNFGMESESLKKGVEENGSQFDDLIPGFGGSSPSTGDSQNIGMDSETKFSQPSSGHSSRSSSSMADDPFLVFQSSRSSANASSWPFSDPLEPNAGKESVASAIDELEKFAMGKVPHDASDKPSVETLGNIRISLGKNGGGDRADASVSKVHIEEEILHGTQRETDKGSIQNVTKEKKEAVVDNSNLDDIFGIGTHSRHVDRARSQTEDPVFDALFHESPGPEVKKTYSGASHNKENSSSATIPFDVFSSIFGEAASSSGEFQEIEGESEERRRARLNNHMRTQAKMAKALAEMNQRDLQTQYEQEEKRRLADTLDYDIKRWSAGKEGNLRALLSALQDVLWPESGWLAVSLTELMTSQNVKKVYYKATLCVHPDKVQQKGSNLQQKYIAEKVFDLIKEAYNKFNAQELQ